ncbi:MAG: penicillin-binding protein 1C [Candidatus Sumerlaeia bacterium]
MAAGIGIGLIVAAAAVLGWPMDTERYLRPEASPEVVDRAGRTLDVFLRGDQQWCLVRELGGFSPWVVKATVAAEDQRFYSHHGVDPVAVARAVVQNVRGRRTVSGASTLSMQVIKLTDGPAGSILGKIAQAVSAVRLELRASKDQILTAYLNRAAYGLNLVGCEAAARRYFGKASAELTLPEAALIAGLPRAPTHLMPLAHAKEAKVRRDWVLGRMREEGMIDADELARAGEISVAAAWHAFPAHAPHLASRIQPASGAVRTTLDLDIQAVAERLVARHAETLGPTIGGGAAIVLDARDASVLAWVGAPDFFNPRGGQVDCAQAERAPGSTLKPFIYGLAIERGKLWPNEALLDDTLDYGLYQPRNFSESHLGLMSADEALRLSLNVPAVIVFDRIGEDATLDFLRRAGLGTLTRPAKAYGLGLALGNCEARLDQLAGAYCMLAALGQWRPVHWTEGSAPAKRLLSRGVCLGLYQILRQPLPKGFESQSVGEGDALSPVCWKTGTSTGLRDAWTFMFNRQYVVGVWVGNPEGKPSPVLVGAHTALPLAARIFRALPRRTDPPWPDFSGELREVEACALSGLPASAWCPHKRRDLVPRELALGRTCDVHWPGEGGRVVERWPGAARGWDLAAVLAPTPSVLSPQSSSLKELRILEPAMDAEYTLTGEAGGDRLRVKASLDEPLHWFVDDGYLGESTPDKPLTLELTEGEHKLVCSTADGRVSAIKYKVTKPE